MTDVATFACGVPVLLADNLENTIDFYTGKLGFHLDFRHGEPTSYVGLSRNHAAIHYALASSRGVGNKAVWRAGMHPADVNFFLDDVNLLHAELQGRGAPVTGKPVDQSYGIRDFDVSDPNGYILRFNQVL